MALVKSGKNGHLARANGAIDGPYCSPTRPSVFGKRCEPLAGRGGGFGGGAAPAPTGGAWGASSIRDSSALVKRAVPRPSGTAPEGYARGVLVSSPVPGRARGGGTRPLLFTTHKPCQNVKMCKKKTVVVHVTRW
jgi:hypothetical protein